MEARYVLSIDQSTSGTKALLIDRSGRIVASRAKAHRQIYPQAGWVEHDPLEIYANVAELMRDVLADAAIGPDRLAAVAIANQRETALLWDTDTGRPAGPAIVWQCRRTADLCEKLKREGHEAAITAKTGLLLDPYFSATKWRWLLDDAERRGVRGRWLAGTIDAWLIWKLTGGAVHATDYTNASRTLAFHLRELRWDEELVRLFGLDGVRLPEVRPSDATFGYVADEDVWPAAARVPICGVMGDSQAALFGQRCTEPGMVKATYGTGTSVLMNVGSAPARASGGLVSALAWKLRGETRYALEGIVHTSGDCLRWARDNMGLFETYEELERLAASVADPDGVYVVPAFVGLGAPDWEPEARAAIVGMNRSTTRAHVLKACLESIAFQVRDAVQLMADGSGVAIRELRADGGATGNRALLQFQADMLGRPVVASARAELSALGAAYAGGLGVGFWSGGELDDLYEAKGRFEPAGTAELRDRRIREWRAAVGAVLDHRARLGGDAAAR